jgi:hypothetical protein
MASIKISRDFFAKARADYADWRWALDEAGADEVIPNLVGYDVAKLLQRFKAPSAR